MTPLFTHKWCRLVLAVVLLGGLLSANRLNAQLLPDLSAQDSVATTSETVPVDSIGRSTPRGTVRGLFKSLGDEDYLQASRYMDLSGFLDGDSLQEVASLVRKIEAVLNRSGKVLPVNLISDAPEGSVNDGLNPSLEEIGSVTFDGERSPILLRAVNQEGDQKIWLLSWETLEVLIAHISENAETFAKLSGPDTALSARWRGAPIRDWLTIFGLALGAYAIAWLFTLLIRWLVRITWGNLRATKYHRFLNTFLIPLRLVITVVILLNLARALGVSIVVRQVFSVVNLIAMWTALFVFIWLLIDALTSFGEEHLRENKSYAGLSAISFFRNTAKFILIVVAILIIFDTVGVDVTAGLAALGVGGIALALGAQKTIENVIGGLSVVFDQPVSVGDYCKFGDTQGTVEKIGMRSTRIRTSNRTVVTVPNSDFSSRLIENFSKRDLFLFDTEIGLRYETSSDQMRYILVELRKMLYAHPKVDPNPARVRFLGYGSDALKVQIYAYFLAKDYNDFLGIQEDINFRIAKVVEDSGSGFAFPSQTVYISRDDGISSEKREAAEQKVREWEENNELPLPEFDAKTIKKLRGSLKYPEKGKGTA